MIARQEPDDLMVGTARRVFEAHEDALQRLTLVMADLAIAIEGQGEKAAAAVAGALCLGAAMWLAAHERMGGEFGPQMLPLLAESAGPLARAMLAEAIEAAEAAAVANAAGDA